MHSAPLDIEIESSFVYSFGFIRVRVAPLCGGSQLDENFEVTRSTSLFLHGLQLLI
jgi:hypothetical protein